MWRCKNVANALAEHRYWELPWLKRWGLRLHVFLCMFCGRYHHQVMDMQDCSHKFRDQEDERLSQSDLQLSEEASQRIANQLKKTD